MQVHFEGHVGTLDVDGKNYDLKQMHWHSPSEHRLNGVQYVLCPILSVKYHLLYILSKLSGIQLFLPINIENVLYHLSNNVGTHMYESRFNRVSPY